jgi:hypothetical protein
VWLTRLLLEGDAAEKASESEWQAREAQIRALTEISARSPRKVHI